MQERSIFGASTYLRLLHHIYIVLSAMNYSNNVCKKIPEKICKKVKDKKCLIIPEETCRDTPRKACKKVPALVPSIKEIRECQTCETYEEKVTEVVYDRKCERHEKPKCYTAHKEVNYLVT